MTHQNYDTETDSRLDGAFRGRRISWEAFWKMRPDRRPDNDNNKEASRDAA